MDKGPFSNPRLAVAGDTHARVTGDYAQPTPAHSRHNISHSQRQTLLRTSENDLNEGPTDRVRDDRCDRQGPRPDVLVYLRAWKQPSECDTKPFRVGQGRGGGRDVTRGGETSLWGRGRGWRGERERVKVWEEVDRGR